MKCFHHNGYIIADSFIPIAEHFMLFIIKAAFSGDIELQLDDGQCIRITPQQGWQLIQQLHAAIQPVPVIMGFLWLWVRLNTPSPDLFRQTRVGRGGPRLP